MMLATVETVRASAGPPDADLNSSPMPYTVQSNTDSTGQQTNPALCAGKGHTFAYNPDLYMRGGSDLYIRPTRSRSYQATPQKAYVYAQARLPNLPANANAVAIAVCSPETS